MDLYTYWLMEKVAEEEKKQEGFIKKHKNKLVGAASVVGGGVAGYGVGKAAEYGVRGIAEIQRKSLAKDYDKVIHSYNRAVSEGKSLEAAAKQTKMEAGAAARMHRSRIKQVNPRLNPNTREEAKAQIRNLSSKVREANKRVKNHLSMIIDAEESRKRINEAQKSFYSANDLGRAWQGVKRLVKDPFSRFLRRK